MPFDVLYGLTFGLIIGIVFGFILQRGRFCINSAIRDPLMLKEFGLIKAVGFAIFVQMIGFAIMHATGIITLNPKPFMWGAQIVGGFVFGIGMVLAGGCASGTTYRVGEGMMGSFVALLGFITGAVASSGKGVLAALVTSFQTSTTIKAGDGSNLTIGGAYNWIVMLVVGIVGVGLMYWKMILPLIKARKTNPQKINVGQALFKKAWPWWFTGLSIGILGCIAYVSSAASGRNYPLGITGGWAGVSTFITTGNLDSLSWEAWLVLGIVLGAFISASIAGEFKIRVPKEGKTILIQFLGGLAMGFGAILAAGCNIGNLLSGIPHLSIGSILASAFIAIGGLFMSYLLFMREK